LYFWVANKSYNRRLIMFYNTLNVNTTGTLPPYVFMHSQDTGFLISEVTGSVKRVTDLDGFMDWWIESKWEVTDTEGHSISLFGSG
jgi:hypothetical protein